LFTFVKDALRANQGQAIKPQGQSSKLLIHKNGSGAATRNSSDTSIKHKMLGIEPRLAFINSVLLANPVLIFCFQLLAVYVLLVHNCGKCRIDSVFSWPGASFHNRSFWDSSVLFWDKNYPKKQVCSLKMPAAIIIF
jgi:hypothetical protein